MGVANFRKPLRAWILALVLRVCGGSSSRPGPSPHPRAFTPAPLHPPPSSAAICIATSYLFFTEEVTEELKEEVERRQITQTTTMKIEVVKTEQQGERSTGANQRVMSHFRSTGRFSFK